MGILVTQMKLQTARLKRAKSTVTVQIIFVFLKDNNYGDIKN